MPRSLRRPLDVRHVARTAVAAAALSALLTPLAVSTADARNKSHSKSGEMMRHGGSTTGNGRMMRLGGPPSRPVDSGIFTLPGRFSSNRPDDIREFFLRRDQAGSGR